MAKSTQTYVVCIHTLAQRDPVYQYDRYSELGIGISSKIMSHIIFKYRTSKISVRRIPNKDSKI